MYCSKHYHPTRQKLTILRYNTLFAHHECCPSSQVSTRQTVVHFSVKHCPPTPEVDGAIADTSSTAAGTVVTYTCAGQGRFTNGLSERKIRCGLDATWSNHPPNCRGGYY